MPAYEPALTGGAVGNVYAPREFDVVATFGTASVASYFGKDIVFTRNSAGNYTVYFPRPFRRLFRFNGGMRDASGAILFPVIVTDAIATAHATTGGGTVIVELRTEAGVATEPTSGDVLFLHFMVSNDVLNDTYVR